MKNETDEIIKILDDPYKCRFKNVRVKFVSQDGKSTYLHYSTETLRDAVENEGGMIYDGFGKIPLDTWLTVDRAKQALGHEPLVSEITEITHNAKVLYKKTNYKLSISYSWGDAEPDRFFSEWDNAWKTAESMAIEEAENSLKNADDTDEAHIHIMRGKGEIVLTYACAYGKDTSERSTCTYRVEKMTKQEE